MKKRTFRTTSHRLGFGVLVSVLLLLAGCSKEEDSNRLPDGKYPVIFTSQVEGLTAEKAATRATVDNSWAGGEEVAVQVGSEVKQYTAAVGGVLSSATPFYWQNTTDVNVSAWYPYNATKPATFTVQQNQSSTGYQQSDMLYASQAVTFHNSALDFKHLPVKVVVNLKNGDDVTEGDVQGATVTIENQATASGMIGGDWSVTQQTTQGNTSIVPNVLGTAASGYQKTVQALLVPQKSTASTRFIKVAVGSQEFYYSTTPDFAAGQQYTYNITVLKSGITVTASGAQEWTGTTSDVASKDPASSFGASDLKIGDYYYSDGTTGDGGYREYTDGSKATLPIMPVLTDASNQPRTVIGIVYWVGDPTNTTNGDPLLARDKSTCTHGLAVSLHDAGGNSLWSSSYEDITSNWLSSQSTTYGITSLKESDKMQGYANTQALIGYNASDRVSSNSNLKVLPIEAITTTYASAHPAPASSSGWYFPSVVELKYMCWGQGNSSGTAGQDFLNAQFEKVSGTSLQSNYYWSSTEYDYSWAWYVVFNDGYANRDDKGSYSYGVRAVAAF